MSTSYLADYRLDGKLAIITGGGQGIGEASAHALVDAGARVLLVGRNEEKLKSVSESLQNNFGSDYFKADLTSGEDISKLFEYVNNICHINSIIIARIYAFSFGSITKLYNFYIIFTCTSFFYTIKIKSAAYCCT